MKRKLLSSMLAATPSEKFTGLVWETAVNGIAPGCAHVWDGKPGLPGKKRKCYVCGEVQVLRKESELKTLEKGIEVAD